VCFRTPSRESAWTKKGSAISAGKPSHQNDVTIQKAEYRERFEHLIREQRCRSGYEVLLCYSGGKDSTFTLAVLKERYGLNVLALTMDNGFMSPHAMTNIRSVTDRLGIDHLLFAPRFDTLASIFRECAQRNIYPPKTLERASAICTSCMSIVNSALCALRSRSVSR